MLRVLPLDMLSPGEVGRVVEIDGDQQLVFRLAEMGVQPGTEVQMLRQGSPCILAVENRRVSFRGENAALILVEVVSHRAALPAPATTQAARAVSGQPSAPTQPLGSVQPVGPALVSSQFGAAEGPGVGGSGASSVGKQVARPRLLARWLGAF